MDCLSKHKVLIDCANKSIKLTTPDGKGLEFVTELVVIAKGVANHAKVNQLYASQGYEVPVVNEFNDVFLKELPGMLIVGWIPIFREVRGKSIGGDLDIDDEGSEQCQFEPV
jgi:hypothetical protein